MSSRHCADASPSSSASLLLAVLPALADPPIKPDPKLTPGAVLEVTKEDICTVGYTKKVRDVPASVKNQVYALYGITSHEPDEDEVDHLILGARRQQSNQEPLPAILPPPSRGTPTSKTAWENKLHSMVCKGELDLKTAQQEIATDWIAAYKKYVEPEPTMKPSTSPASVRTPPTTSPFK